MIAKTNSNCGVEGLQGQVGKYDREEGVAGNSLPVKKTPSPGNGVGEKGITATRKPAPGSLLRVSQVASLLGVCPTSVRNMVREGQLTAFRLPSGHRRITKASVNEYLGFDANDNAASQATNCTVAAYCRVSTSDQEKVGSLQRQIEVCKKYIVENYGVKEGEVVIVKDTGSALNDRKGLNRLCDMIIGGELKTLVCHYFDRISRVNCLSSLVRHLCKRFGVTIVVIEDNNEDLDDMGVFVNEIMAMFTCYCNKLSGAKGGRVVAVEVGPETTERILELRSNGYNVNQIRGILDREGHSYANKDGRKIAYNKIAEIVNNSEPLTEIIKVKKSAINENRDKEKERKVIREWFATRVNMKGEEKDSVSIVDMYFDYVDYARKNKVTPTNNTFFTATLNRTFPEIKERVYKSSGRGGKCYRGMTLTK